MADPQRLNAREAQAGFHRGLFITPVAPWNSFGGTATVSRNLTSLFIEAMPTHVCCLRANEAGIYPQMMHGATVLSGPVTKFGRQVRFFFDWSRESFAHRQFERRKVRQRLTALLAEQRPAFVVLDHIFSAWVIDLLPRDLPLVFIAHDDMVAYADSMLRLHPAFSKRVRLSGLRRQYKGLQEKVVKRSELVLTMTEEDAAIFRVSSTSQVEVAPLFFEFPQISTRPGAEFSYLLATGSFDTWEKRLGLSRFVREIFAPLQNSFGDLRLMVAGRIPHDLQRTLDLPPSVLEIVHQPSEERMQQVIAGASAAVVLDLQSSGLKIKTVELATAGLPILSWPPGLEGTGLVDEESCLLASTTEEFTHKLHQLFRDRELRQRLGDVARATMLERFSRAKARAELEKLKPLFFADR
ncbi:MAG TPA: glycosyltransferase [Chthoniobacteraceae bacterium]|jgi:glycosyltransferase involved in cell wall biosynthesis